LLRGLNRTLRILRQQQPLGDLPRRLSTHRGDIGIVVRITLRDRRSRVVELTAQGKRLAASCFERHAKDLEALMSVLSEREMEQLHGSLKKLGLLAAEKLDQQEAKVKISKEQARKSRNDLRNSLQ